MKILSIKTYVLSNKIKKYKFPLPSFFYDGILILNIKTDQDIVSFIEISPYATDIKILRIIYNKSIIPLLINQEINNLLKIRETITIKKFGTLLSSVIKSSITQIYFDIKSKSTQKPISHILNPGLKSKKNKIKFYASGGMIFENQDYDILIDEAIAAKEMGFYGWKFRPKTPINNPSHSERKKYPPDFDKNLIISFIEKLKKNVGDDFKIMIDFGQRIKKVHHNKDLFKCIEENNLFFIEEPMKYNIDNYKKLTKIINTKIAGCESFTDTIYYNKWLDNSLINFIQPDSNLIPLDKIYKFFYKKKINNIIMHNWCLPMNTIFNISIHNALQLNNIIEYNITFNPIRDMIFEENFNMKNNLPEINDSKLSININNNLLRKFDISDTL